MDITEITMKNKDKTEPISMVNLFDMIMFRSYNISAEIVSLFSVRDSIITSYYNEPEHKLRPIRCIESHKIALQIIDLFIHENRSKFERIEEILEEDVHAEINRLKSVLMSVIY